MNHTSSLGLPVLACAQSLAGSILVNIKPCVCFLDSQYGARFRVAGYRSRRVFLYHVAATSTDAEFWFISTHAVSEAPSWMRRAMSANAVFNLVYDGAGCDLGQHIDIAPRTSYPKFCG